MITNSKKKLTDPEGPASPVYTDWQKSYDGLTKREYFAAMAMQGILGNRELQLACAYDYKGEDKNDAVSEFSVQQADALIKALNKKDE